VEPAGAQLHDLLPAKPLEELGGVLMSLRVAVSGDAVLLVAPPGAGIIKKRSCKKQTQQDEAHDRSFSIPPLSRSHSRVQASLVGDDGGVPGAAGDVDDREAHENLDASWGGVARLVAMSELPVHAPAPPARRENDGDRERAVFACVRHPIRKTNDEEGGEIDFLSFCPPSRWRIRPSSARSVGT